MLDKKFITTQYEQLHELICEHSLENELGSKLEQLKTIIDTFSLKLLTIGAFSAGKSALLNHLIQEDLLVEEQTPETAIATELKYSPIEHYEIVDLKNEAISVEKNQLKTANPETTLNLRYALNNPFLRRFDDYTLVDMPGFNSNIEQHNKAILQYIGQGNAYLLVLDCEDGGIKASVREFMDEIRQYQHNLIIVISKSDKKTPSQIEKIKQNVMDQAGYLFNAEVPVVTFSKYDEMARENLADSISQINVQSIFEQATIPLVKELYSYVQIAINQSLKSVSLDNKEIQEEIYKRQKAKADLEHKLKAERSKLTHRMNNQVLPGIIGAVESVLFANSTELANAAISGQHAFSSRVNSLLRPVLLENTKRYTEESYAEFLREINLESILSDKTDEIVQGVTDKIRQLTSLIEKADKTGDAFNKSYKAITGVLAIATTAVAPWLEIIILFLPEILKLFGVGGRDSQVEKLRSSIENEVIPQIISKLRPAIQESLIEVENQLLQDIEDSICLAISIEEDALAKARDTQQQADEEHSSIVKNYEEKLKIIADHLQAVGQVAGGSVHANF
ncbi:MAG: dynamin family protein [Neobacillus sp.]